MEQVRLVNWYIMIIGFSYIFVSLVEKGYGTRSDYSTVVSFGIRYIPV